LNLLPRTLSDRLSKWVEGGRYADLFDHVDDTLNVQRFQVFDFQPMRAYPMLLEPLLFLRIHRVNAALDSGLVSRCASWTKRGAFIQHPTLRGYVAKRRSRRGAAQRGDAVGDSIDPATSASADPSERVIGRVSDQAAPRQSGARPRAVPTCFS
jgi:hypothetical protein